MNRRLLSGLILLITIIAPEASVVSISNSYWKLSITSDKLDAHPAGSVVELVDNKYRQNNWVCNQPFLAPHYLDTSLANGIIRSEETSIIFSSPAMITNDGESIPLTTEIKYTLTGPFILIHYRFTADGYIDEARCLEAQSAFEFDGIEGYTNGIRDTDSTSLFSPNANSYDYYLNQLLIIHSQSSDLGLVCPRPFDSNFWIDQTSGTPSKLNLRFLVADGPFYGLGGDPYHSILKPGTVIDREYQLFALPAKSRYESLSQPIVYLSPHPEKTDRSVLFLWDEIPTPHPNGGPWLYSYYEDGPNAVINNIIRILNDHQRAKMVLLMVLDSIGPEIIKTIENVGDYYGWAGCHGVNRMKSHAPPDYTQWVRDMMNHNPSYPWMQQIDIGLHGYHHSQSMQELIEHEFEIAGYERAEALFNAVHDDLDYIKLDPSHIMPAMRFPGFQYVQDALRASAKWGIRFYDNYKEFEHFRLTRLVFPEGELFGVNTCWWSDYSNEMPDHGRPFTYIRYVLDKGKIALLGGHPGSTFPSYQPTAYQRMERAMKIIDSYPDLNWVFPNDLIAAFDRQKLVHGFTVQANRNSIQYTYTGSLETTDTIIVDRIDKEKAELVTIDGIIPVDKEYRQGKLYINHCPQGDFTHIIEIPIKIKEEKPSSTKLLVFPNPASANVCFRLEGVSSGTIRCKVYDIAGNLVDDGEGWEWQTNNASLLEATRNFSSLASGIYLVQLEVVNGKCRAKLTSKFAILR